MRMWTPFVSTVVFSFVVVISSLTPSLLYGQRPFVKTSMCEALTHSTRFDGKRVEFHAKYSGTFEGTWITDTECAAAGELLLPSDHGLARRYGVDRGSRHCYGIITPITLYASGTVNPRTHSLNRKELPPLFLHIQQGAL